MSSRGQDVCKRRLGQHPGSESALGSRASNKKGTLFLGAPVACAVYSHFLRCPSGSSHPGTVSAVGNPNSPESCCWTTGRSGSLCRCGSRPSAWRGSEAGRAGLATPPPWRVLWVCHSRNLLGALTPHFSCKQLPVGGYQLGARHCAGPFTGEKPVWTMASELHSLESGFSALPLPSCVLLLINLSVPQFLFLQNGNNYPIDYRIDYHIV